MKNKFKNKDKVFVYGPGENAGKFYKKQPAFIIERDSYYLDYLVKLKDGTEDWIEEKYLRKPYARKYQKYRKRKKSKKIQEKRS